MSRFIIIVLCVSLFVGCEKEKLIEVEVEREYNWKVDENFSYDNQLQMNSRVVGDLMFFMGYTYFTCMTSEGSSHPQNNGQDVVPYVLWGSPPPNRKTPIGDDFFVNYSTNGRVTFVPNLAPISQSSRAEVRLDELDENFRFIDGMFYSRGESMLINDRNQVLIPYEDNTTQVTMTLVDISYDRDDIVVRHNLDTVKTTIIRIDEPVQNAVIAMESIGSDFFVSTDSKVFRVDADAQVQEVLNQRLYQFFEIGNEIFGVGTNDIFISSDNGLSWVSAYRNPGNMEIIEYIRLGDRLVAYRFAQLWELTRTNDALEFTELDNDGLDGRSITSVSLFEGQVYVSTLSGVFSKSLDEFFIPKEITD